MPDEFLIQASNPRAFSTRDPNDLTLTDAIETIFPLNTECALIVWNWIYIPLSYKYDIGAIIEDLMGILEQIHAAQCSTLSIHWTSNTFAAIWHLTWGHGKIDIHAEWNSIIGNVEHLLRQRPAVSLSVHEFTVEWKSILMTVERALEGAGYNETNLSGMSRLRQVIASLAGDGLLYRAASA